ncbi:MAG: NAD-dependent epimerase/dehydratase family protein [Anaerolineae bacterium]|nr:NAD-dependent epimerase/dehydratase family protein [Anaerolineae bacterium]
MKILIIGGTGLISTAIARQLVERGDEVTLYNRGQRKADIPHVAQFHGDRTDYAAFEAQMQDASIFDVVIDMVAFQPEDVQSAVRAFQGRTGQYIFCSTVDVYTKPARVYPVTEDAERQPSAAFPYAWNKARCEEILFEAHARGNLAVTAIRPAYTYGVGSILHSFGWNTYFLDRLRRGKPVIVHGDGTSLWTACHRDDVARAFVGAAGNPDALGKGYHAAGEEWLTWNQYVEAVAGAIGAPRPTLVHIPSDLLVRLAPQAAEWCAVNFQYNNIFDNRAARRDLGFRYTIPIVEGVRRVVAGIEAFGDADDFPFYDRLIKVWQRSGVEMVRALT